MSFHTVSIENGAAAESARGFGNRLGSIHMQHLYESAGFRERLMVCPRNGPVAVCVTVQLTTAQR